MFDDLMNAERPHNHEADLYRKIDQLHEAMVEIERITWREGNSRHDLSKALIDVRKIAKTFTSVDAKEPSDG